MATGDIDDPVDYGTIVRNNLMKRPGYAPYCMGQKRTADGEGWEQTMCFASFQRMRWDGEQFSCRCGARTEFPDTFIKGYKARWHTEGAR